MLLFNFNKVLSFYFILNFNTGNWSGIAFPNNKRCYLLKTPPLFAFRFVDHDTSDCVVSRKVVRNKNRIIKMYRIEIPSTIHHLFGIFYRLGMWTHSDTTTFRDFCRKIFYLLYIVSFALSIALGALKTENTDECVFLTVVSVIILVQTYRMWIILWHKNEILLLIDQIGKHCTNDRGEFIRINKKLNVMMKFVRYFLIAFSISYLFGFVLYPITSDNRLILDIAFPLDWNSSNIGFWMASGFVGVGAFLAIVCAIITKVIWYLMLSISFEYKLLGNQLKHMGMIRTGTPHFKVSLAAQRQLFYKDFIMAVQMYDKINGCVNPFLLLLEQKI